MISANLSPQLLPIEHLNAFEDFCPRINYAKGEVIHQRDEDKPGFSIITRGNVKVGNYDKQGNYLLTQVLGELEIFGEITLFTHYARSHTVEALSDCEVIQVSRDSFEYYAAQNPSIRDVMLTMLAEKLRTCVDLMDDLRHLSVTQRLAKLLLNFASAKDAPHVKLRQSDLADHLGLTILTVHRALKRLASEGLIELKYGGIEVVNASELARFAQR
ncbi:Crp/Fnr family transcriptional regulator [uncultured Umboniibacter sp.]|uniref:Crp/Fnr family transcriptional regulator n=1 Tax=uncultured Umboniibacter sp. TaxID=1798917 RepID=UPI002630FE3B|nr:Crp/Fnr family transcriptional regulator [uncultured Umboniibacter sp.]